MQNITVAGAAPPIIRPGEALVLWLMEGRLTLLDAGLLSPGVTTPWKALMASFPAPRDHPFSAADLTGADVADVTKLVRTLLLWNFFGLDELTKTVWDAVAQDTVPAWSPTPNPTLAASVAVHDAKLAAGLAAISVRSISRPIAAATQRD